MQTIVKPCKPPETQRKGFALTIYNIQQERMLLKRGKTKVMQRKYIQGYIYKIARFEMTKGEDVSSNRKHNTERNKNDPGTRKELYKRVNQRQE